MWPELEEDDLRFFLFRFQVEVGQIKISIFFHQSAFFVIKKFEFFYVNVLTADYPLLLSSSRCRRRRRWYFAESLKNIWTLFHKMDSPHLNCIVVRQRHQLQLQQKRTSWKNASFGIIRKEG